MPGLLHRMAAPNWAVLVCVVGAGDGVSACDLSLVLALDGSTSMTVQEYDLERTGLAAAFRDPQVIDAILAMDGGMIASVTQWAGPDHQRLSVGWTALLDAKDISDFAEKIDLLRNPFHGTMTAVGNALRHARTVLAVAAKNCDRSVVDLSSDGIANSGIDTAAEAEELASGGVQINALVIVDGLWPYPEDIVDWYAATVIRGAGSFVEQATGPEQYAAAIRRKLLRELRAEAGP
jgi:Ca-activated chloride channel family protein